MRRQVIFLILSTGLLRIIIASFLELSNDEVYYYSYALNLQPNYFDHPPIVGILIRIFTANLFLNDEVFVRLGAIVCASIGTIFSYMIGKMLKNERTGFYAAVLYNTSIYTSVLAGTFVLPDSPQVVFWLASVVVSLRIAVSTIPTKTQWLTYGLLVGLTMLCKVHGVFLWVGFGLYILLYKRKWLLTGGPYLSMGTTLLLISPIVWWNFENHFITFRFHSDRVDEVTFHLSYFFQSIVGQFLYNNPINVILIMIGLYQFRTTKFLGGPAFRFILLQGLPLIIIVSAFSLFNSMLPHWSGPGFMILMFIAAAWCDEIKEIKKSIQFPSLIKASALLLGVSMILGLFLINFFPGTMGSQEKNRFGDGDFTLDMYGWQQFSNDFRPWFQSQIRNKTLSEDIHIVSHKWFPAAHIDYYLAIPMNIPLIGLGRVEDIHNYNWLNKLRDPLQKGEDALCIIPSNYYVDIDLAYLPSFHEAKLLRVFENRRGGKLARYFSVYLLKDFDSN